MSAQKTNLDALFAGNVWEYLVGDFLETACFLGSQERDYLIRRLQDEKIAAERIDVHPCFSVNGRTIIICDNIAPTECWFFHPSNRQVLRWFEPQRVSA